MWSGLYAILKTMEDETAGTDRQKPSGDDGSAVAYGMVAGMLVGVLVGVFTHNIGLWLPIGIGIGVALGAAFSETKSSN